jgi:anti-sigma regulatory factor (Ser/Thr protein kinase)/biotin operon repressor
MIDDSGGKILRLLAGGPVRSTDVAAALGISRQAAHARLAALLDAGLIVREGAARATRYRLPERPRWERTFPLAGLAEDHVLRQLSAEVETVRRLEGEAADVVGYLVTELVNNAIDHSSGGQVRVAAGQRGAVLTIEVEDDGVGAFAHVREHFDLPSELAAVQELSKGKTTTAPDRHTGEGLFFVSKAVDWFRLESGGLAWLVDNERDDMAIAKIDPPRRGTLAVVAVDLDTVRPLRALFEEYTDDYEFSKTRTVIRLFEIGVRFVSRSEAKRLLHGLDRFREVVLDFRGVQGIGQGFADEVFRVWVNDHPDVLVLPVHMNDAVAFMIERARRHRS